MENYSNRSRFLKILAQRFSGRETLLGTVFQNAYLQTGVMVNGIGASFINIELRIARNNYTERFNNGVFVEGKYIFFLLKLRSDN